MILLYPVLVWRHVWRLGTGIGDGRDAAPALPAVRTAPQSCDVRTARKQCGALRLALVPPPPVKRPSSSAAAGPLHAHGALPAADSICQLITLCLCCSLLDLLAQADPVRLCPAPDHDVARQLPYRCESATTGHMCLFGWLITRRLPMMAAWRSVGFYGRLCLRLAFRVGRSPQATCTTWGHAGGSEARALLCVGFALAALPQSSLCLPRPPPLPVCVVGCRGACSTSSTRAARHMAMGCVWTIWTVPPCHQAHDVTCG